MHAYSKYIIIVLRYYCTKILYSDTYCPQVIKAYTLIVSFMPAISALSGNLGLQASANTIRGLGTGHIDQGKYFSNMWKEVKSGFLSATIIATTICAIGTLWAYSDADNAAILET